MSSSVVPTVAKRTHARRSCELCKIRKTRCELPDIDVLSSSEPQPLEKSCHRCRVLLLPCIVDDVARKPHKKRARAGEGEDGDEATTRKAGAKAGGKGSRGGKGKGKAPATGDASGSGVHADRGEGVDHSLEVMHGIHPQLEWTGSNGEPELYSSDPFLRSSPLSSTFGASGPPTNTMKLHSRPLELVCAMLRIAYSKSDIKDGRTMLSVDKINWAFWVDAPMKEKLEIGFAQLRTFHPYLDPFDTIYDKCAVSHLPEEQLLLLTIVYLCTLPLAPSLPVTKLRTFFRPRISFFRDRVLLQAPASFTTLQALELLGVHAPLGVLPLQLTDPRSLSVARGQLALLQYTSYQLKYPLFFSTFAAGKGDDLWNFSDGLLFLSTTALEASMALEDEVPRAPAALHEVRQIALQYLDESREHFWENGQTAFGAAGSIGRLGVFDRLARSGEVLDSLDRLRAVLETAAADTAFNPVDAIAEEFLVFAQKMDRCDSRHQAILDIISPFSNNLERGYVMHRSMRRRYEHIKVLSVGLRYLIATSYIPGSRLALPSVPSDIPARARVAYAIERANNPADIMPVLTQNSPATMVIWQYGAHRGEISQQILNGLADLEEHVVPKSHAYSRRPSDMDDILEALDTETEASRTAELLPLHECIGFAVDSAKMLMEARAGTLLLQKRSGNLHDATLPPIWVNSLKRACHTLRLVGLMSPPEARGEWDRGPGQGETVANGCSNILGSMVRMTEEWGRAGQPGPLGEGTVPKTEEGYPAQDDFHAGIQDGVEAYRRDQADQDLTDLLQPPQSQTHYSPYTPPTHLQPHGHGFSAAPPSEHSGHGSSYPPLPPQQDAPPHGYMDSSDRWMAGGGEGQGTPHTTYHTLGSGPSEPYPTAQPHHSPHAPHRMVSPQTSFASGAAQASGSGGAPQYAQGASGAHQQGGGGGQGQLHGPGYPATALDLLLSQMFQYGPPKQPQ